MLRSCCYSFFVVPSFPWRAMARWCTTCAVVIQLCLSSRLVLSRLYDLLPQYDSIMSAVTLPYQGIGVIILLIRRQLLSQRVSFRKKIGIQLLSYYICLSQWGSVSYQSFLCLLLFSLLSLMLIWLSVLFIYDNFKFISCRVHI